MGGRGSDEGARGATALTVNKSTFQGSFSIRETSGLWNFPGMPGVPRKLEGLGQSMNPTALTPA